MNLRPGTPVQDLALAEACLNGDARAWESFIALYRPKLYDAALSVARDKPLAYELADSVWAELYGTRVNAQGRRISKLASYSGRGSLEGWLRALVAQEFVNRIRSERRFVSFDDAFVHDKDPASSTPESGSVDPRLDTALDRALAELKPVGRFLLASHYLDERSLADIGVMLNLHESTVSRRLRKTLQFVRKRTVHHLRRSGMSMREAEETVSVNLHETSLDLRKTLAWAREVL